MDAVLEDRSIIVARETFTALKEKSLELRNESIEFRKARLKALRAWIHQNSGQLYKSVYADLRKPEIEFDAIEILYVLNEIKTALTNLDQWVKPKPIDATLEMLGTRSEIRYEPRGVCLIISPWNYPFSLCISPFISALAAGNSIMLKPSEMSPNISAEIKRMAKELFDPSVVSVVEGGAEITSELLKLPFDHIFFTGSPRVGKLVMKAAAENLTSVTLELGGKCPAIVTSTARIDDAAQRIAVSKFVNAGQTCVAPDYVLVEHAIAEKFTERLISLTKNSFANKNDFPKIITKKHFDRLNELMEDALDKGASIMLNGATDPATQSFNPTILSNVEFSTRIMQEEIFGPLLPIVTFSKVEEAVGLVNTHPKPLGLYLFSQSNREKEFILHATSSGGVCINDCSIQFLHHKLPFGGVNSSGMGKSHGYSGFLTFSNEKPVLKQRNGFTSVKILYPPYAPRIHRLLKTFMKLFYR